MSEVDLQDRVQLALTQAKRVQREARISVQQLAGIADALNTQDDMEVHSGDEQDSLEEG